MTKTLPFVFAVLSLTAGCSAIGSTGQDTSFERVGSLNCGDGSVQEQALVVGTDADPVRCGPQTQPIVQ
jgi:hypothetical protein